MNYIGNDTPANFDLIGGGVLGRDHRVASRNYQDGLHIVRQPDCMVAVVTDGCGSGAHSEVGAQLGARLLCDIVAREAAGNRQVNWPRVLRHLTSALDVLARQLGGNYRRTVEEYFLFTFIGAVLCAGDSQRAGRAVFFGLGDGVIVTNGYVRQIGPYPGNMPPYAGYDLLRSELNIDPALIEIWAEVWPLTELEHFLLGTDGAADLITAATANVPGMMQPAGGLDQFWQDDRYFGGNPELLSRRLKLLARDWPKRHPEPGLLPDDTTIIVGRRRLTPHDQRGE